ncbi:MAG TPA: exodeoxyribonuclease VII small subunit [Candidatus Binataceae bacterium]|nr:exodeoxyribonuclease VII small subunit [Candidatus Binataceae bacterium]
MANSTPPKADSNNQKFEDGLADLEAIVARIDSGELPLEESIQAFERGVALVRALNQKLDEVEKKIEVLVRDNQGQLRTAAYREPAGEDEDEGA